MSRAWILTPRGAEAVEAPAPPPDDGDVVIAVEAAQLARGDLARTGVVPGEAAVGVVVAAGAHATGLLGRRVAVGPCDPCGECEVCRRGGAAVCPTARRRGGAARGTCAERVTASARAVVALEDGLVVPGPAAAALAGVATLAYTAYARASVGPREPVVVVGADTATRLLVEVLVAKGVTPTLLVDAPSGPATGPTDDPAWRAAVAARGAAFAEVPAGEAGAEADRAALAAALAGQAVGARPWRVIAVDPAAVPRAAGVTGPRSTLAAVAGPGAALAAALLDREVAVTGVAGGHPALAVEVAALVARGELDLAGAVAVHGLDELPAAPGARAVVVTLPG